MANWIVLLLTLSWTSQVFAKSFVLGTVWPVKEKNMAELLQQRAASLNTQELQDHWQSRARDYYERPKGLALPRAFKSQSHEYVPTAHAYQDITDHEGRLIAQAGTSINVLKKLPFYRPELYFFNADDKAQLAFVKGLKITPNTKLILVAGNVAEAQKTLNQKVYFDQEGKLCQTFAIKQVPAYVHRQNDVLLVDEIKLRGEGV